MKNPPDATYPLFGAEAMLNRLRALTKQIEGVCEGEDIEYVHKMRVASRRLRAAMAMFKNCLPPEKQKAWRNTIQEVTRRLGPARDLDVQIEFVSGFAEGHEDPTLQPGVWCLLQHLQTQRLGLQCDVRKAVKQLRKNPMLQEARSDLRKLRRQGRLVFKKEFASRYSAAARDTARTKMITRFRKFLAFEPWVVDPLACHELHEMRIAAKQFRYAMEIFDPLWFGQLTDATQIVKGFQRTLGGLHDCDVWIDFLPAFLHDHRQIDTPEAFGRIVPGLQSLLADRREERARLYETFHGRYRACQAEGFWEQLHETLRREPAPPESGTAGGDE